MSTQNKFAWSSRPVSEQLNMVETATRGDLRQMARAFDWARQSDEVLSAIMSRRDIDLATALTVFFNADPGRFNYLFKHEIPTRFRATVTMLDMICRRINSGFYRPALGQLVDDLPKLLKWMTFQIDDVEDGERGRWVFDQDAIGTVLKPWQQDGVIDAERSGTVLNKKMREEKPFLLQEKYMRGAPMRERVFSLLRAQGVAQARPRLADHQAMPQAEASVGDRLAG